MGVFVLAARRSPETGSLLVDGGQGGEFLGTFSDLPPGDYLLLADEATGMVSAFSVGGHGQTPLFRGNLSESEGVDHALLSDNLLVSLPAAGPSLRFYDLDRQEWFGLDPYCHVLRYTFAPNGQRVAAMCDEPHQLETAPSGFILMEALSIPEGVGTLLELPLSPTTRDLPSISWLDSGVALVSSVWVEGELRTCAVSIDDATMYCPWLGLEGLRVNGRDLATGSPLIPFFDFGNPPRTALVHRRCFQVGEACPGVIEPKIDRAAILVTTLDPQIIWWIEPLSADPTTEVGLVDPSAGEASQLVSLGGDYSGRGVCPDGSCLYLYHLDSRRNWRLHLDGSIEVLPFEGDVVIASFQVP